MRRRCSCRVRVASWRQSSASNLGTFLVRLPQGGCSCGPSGVRPGKFATRSSAVFCTVVSTDHERGPRHAAKSRYRSRDQIADDRRERAAGHLRHPRRAHVGGTTPVRTGGATSDDPGTADARAASGSRRDPSPAPRALPAPVQRLTGNDEGRHKGAAPAAQVGPALRDELSCDYVTSRSR